MILILYFNIRVVNEAYEVEIGNDGVAFKKVNRLLEPLGMTLYSCNFNEDSFDLLKLCNKVLI